MDRLERFCKIDQLLKERKVMFGAVRGKAPRENGCAPQLDLLAR